jgi:hypothetical protein
MQTISPSATIDSIDKLPGLTTDAAKCKVRVCVASAEGCASLAVFSQP